MEERRMDMRFPNAGHRRPNIKIRHSGKWLPLNDRGGTEYVLGMYALAFVMIMAMVSLQIMQYKADSDIAEDALTASALAALDVDPYAYGRLHSIVIDDPENARQIFEEALRDNMKLNDRFEPADANSSYVCGRVSIDDFRVYLVSGDEVTEYNVGISGTSSGHGIYGEMKTPSGKEIRSAGVYAAISFDASGFMGVKVRAQKDTYVEVMANPDRQP